MIIAGEASGDMHGASLMRELKAENPDLEIVGIGGDKMIDEGLIAKYHIKDMAFLGFVEILKHIPFIRKVQKELLNLARNEKIEKVVLIDYPGFNLNIAKKFKKLGMQVIYYISPQIWAWRQKRVKKIQKRIDKMLVVFPFEKDWYAERNVDVEYVGHPLIESIGRYKFLEKENLFEKYSLDKSKELLLILAGSRKQEIEKIFPKVIDAAEKLSEKFNLQTVVACSQNIDEEIFRNKSDYDFTVIKGKTYDLLKHSKFGIIKSGTSTLEAALLKLPFVVVYSTSSLTYLIGKSLIKLDKIAMANIIAGEFIVDELIQDEVNSSSIFEACSKYLSNPELYSELKNKLSKIEPLLGGEGASKNAAKLILQY